MYGQKRTCMEDAVIMEILENDHYNVKTLHTQNALNVEGWQIRKIVDPHHAVQGKILLEMGYVRNCEEVYNWIFFLEILVSANFEITQKPQGSHKAMLSLKSKNNTHFVSLLEGDDE